MPETGTLLLVESVLPALAIDQPSAIRMDLHMLALFEGRERTQLEYQRLLESADLRLGRIIPTTSPSGISILEATPAAA